LDEHDQIRILVVEDDPTFSDVVKRLLEISLDARPGGGSVFSFGIPNSPN